MELFDLMRLKHRGYQHCVIENKAGQVFCAYSKSWDFEGNETLVFIQTNTEEVPKKFECTYQQFSDAMEQGKIKFV